MVARSSAEVEFCFIANGICELLWLKKLFSELGFPVKGPMNLFCDNKAAINIAHDPIQHDRTKHVEIDQYFIKDHNKSGCICIPFVQMKYQLTDIFTKELSSVHFSYIVNKLEMIDSYLWKVLLSNVLYTCMCTVYHTVWYTISLQINK